MGVMGVMDSGRGAARAYTTLLVFFPQSQPSAEEAYQQPKLHTSYTQASPKPVKLPSRLHPSTPPRQDCCLAMPWVESQSRGPRADAGMRERWTSKC